MSLMEGDSHEVTSLTFIISVGENRRGPPADGDECNERKDHLHDRLKVNESYQTEIEGTKWKNYQGRKASIIYTMQAES